MMNKKVFFLLSVLLACKSEPNIVIGKESWQEWHSPYSILGNKYGEGYYYDVCWLVTSRNTINNTFRGVQCYCSDTAKWSIGDTIKSKNINKYDIVSYERNY